jgi:ankyrin repeat protein
VRQITARIGARQALRILQLCGVVKRPLTVDEFREVLSVEPGQRSLDRGSLPNDMDRILSDCCGLTFVDEEENTVHYVHHSVRKHLFESLHSHRFIQADLDKHFGFLCMTYLNFNDFKRQLVKAEQGSGAPLNPLGIGISAIRHQSSLSNRVAQKLLRQSRQSQLLTAGDLGRKAQEILGYTQASRIESELNREFCLLAYARTYWIYHLINIDDTADEKIWKLFCKCVDGDVVEYRPWNTAPSDKHHEIEGMSNMPSEMKWILANGHNSLLLYHALSDSPYLTEAIKGEILRHAAIADRPHFVEILIRHTESRRETLSMALQLAAREGRVLIVMMLLAAMADVNTPERVDGRTALQAAAGGGHIEVVEKLLAANANINAPAEGYGGRTALQAAAEGGHVEVVEKLLAAKADINAPATVVNGRTALQAAAGGGHIEVVEKLLAAKADINAPATSNGSRTALQAAAEGGHVKVVEKLLAVKANIDAPAAWSNGRTALQAAAGEGHVEVVEKLLAATADANALAASFDGQKALQAAMSGGHTEVMLKLLAAKTRQVGTQEPS